MNVNALLQNPDFRLLTVIIVTTLIASGIVLLMKDLLTPACSNGYHYDPTLNTCVPDCKDGKINAPIKPGECVIKCPPGQISSKVVKPNATWNKYSDPEVCVTPCGDGACLPPSYTGSNVDRAKTVCSPEKKCVIPNCLPIGASAPLSTYCDANLTPSQHCGVVVDTATGKGVVNDTLGPPTILTEMIMGSGNTGCYGHKTVKAFSSTCESPSKQFTPPPYIEVTENGNVVTPTVKIFISLAALAIT